MKLHRTDALGIHTIRACDEGRIVVGDAVYTRSLIVSPDAIVAHWTHPAPALLRSRDMAPALDLRPELILLGTGLQFVLPDFALMIGHQSRGIGFEVMDTAAACRTYNILAGDGRRVVAALMLGC